MGWMGCEEGLMVEVLAQVWMQQNRVGLWEHNRAPSPAAVSQEWPAETTSGLPPMWPKPGQTASCQACEPAMAFAT